MRAKALLIGMTVIISSGFGGWLAQSELGFASAGSSPASGFLALGPTRVLDTRTGAKPAADAVLTVVTGLDGATAVGVNITLTETDGIGFATAWSGIGGRPATSVVNSSGPSENIANYVIVPVAADGSFRLYTSGAAHLIVDLMGYFVGGSSPIPSGLSGTVTGYSPLTTSTEVSGVVSNGTNVVRDARVDVRCPDGTTARTKEVLDIAPGQSLGYVVFCNGLVTSGAAVEVVEI